MTRGTPWPDIDIKTLIEGKVVGLSYNQIRAQLTSVRSVKAVERRWARAKVVISKGKSPYTSGEFVDLVDVRKRLPAQPTPAPADEFDQSQDGIVIDEKDNSLKIFSKSRRIKTLDDLIEACEIDEVVWLIERHKINKWEVGAKLPNEFGDMEITTSPLFQVTAWMIRRSPIAIDPVVSPVVITVSRTPKVKKVESGALLNALALPDPQCGFYKSLRTGKLTPFHDRAALDVALQIAQEYDIQKTIWLGDLMDLAEFTDKFIRSPNYFWSTQPAAIECKWWLTQFVDANPKGEHFAMEGNHDKRLQDQLIKHFKEAFKLRAVDELEGAPLMSIPKILALHDIGMQWIEDYPNGEVWINDQLVCEHGATARAKSGATVSAMAVDATVSRVFGHTHRLECATKTIHERTGARTVKVWSMGCLCRIDGVVPGVKERQNWQQALGFIEYLPTGEHEITPIEIHDGRAIFRGKIYEARDRVEQLKDDTAGTKAEWNW